MGNTKSGKDPAAVLGTVAQLFWTETGGQKPPERELDCIPFPDLLYPSPESSPDPEPLIHLLDLAYLGRASAGELDANLDGMSAGDSQWISDHFINDLFLSEVVQGSMGIVVREQPMPTHRGFLERVLAHPPVETETIRFRQAILRELEKETSLLKQTEALFCDLCDLMQLLRASRDDARLEPLRFRLDLLRTFRNVVARMDEAYREAKSGLQRLHEIGELIRESAAFQRMAALLDHESGMATLKLEAIVGADGKLRHLQINELRELKKNPFYRRPLRRWWDRLCMIYHRYSLESPAVVDFLIMGVFHEIEPAMARTIQLLGHLEVYLASRSFVKKAQSHGLEVCLPDFDPRARMRIKGLFNPLLLSLVDQPVATDIDSADTSQIILVTGPNSGGKTRLLQAVGIVQVLAQSGLYAPCTRAELPIATSLFASIVEVDRADQPEGRLGTELMRLRTLFETVPKGSLVLLDELCSGTNPSEAIEIVDLVLRLLRRLDPQAFVTTHFLGFAQEQLTSPTVAGLGFLQAEVNGHHGATYRFVPGVAATSLAVGTARRLGVVFDELGRDLENRVGEEPDRSIRFHQVNSDN